MCVEGGVDLSVLPWLAPQLVQVVIGLMVTELEDFS